jgi:hypothetical protein
MCQHPQRLLVCIDHKVQEAPCHSVAYSTSSHPPQLSEIPVIKHCIMSHVRIHAVQLSAEARLKQRQITSPINANQKFNNIAYLTSLTWTTESAVVDMKTLVRYCLQPIFARNHPPLIKSKHWKNYMN